MNDTLDTLAINTLRFLAVDAVEAAKSGHPGAPLGAAPLAHTLWQRFLKHNPADPTWPNRDRFVLSPGHMSALLYGLLHLHGYDLPLEEIKRFRQWESLTPGHPEFGLTPGVEVTTGPLGQGFANGVGMALAERFLATHYNRPGFPIVDHRTFGVVSDGDLEEGISYEAASLAGHWRLGKLVYLYDSNGIQIEGSTGTNFTDGIRARFESVRWQVVGPVDGNDVAAIAAAIEEAIAETDRPSLVIVNTQIGFGSPLVGQAATHGAPLGAENVRRTKENLGWPLEPAFHVPEQMHDYVTAAARRRGDTAQTAWRTMFAAYAEAHPDLAAKLRAQLTGELPGGWDDGLDELFTDTTKQVATRGASGKILNLVARQIDYLLGGSADLGPSNQTEQKGYPELSWEQPGGNNIHFGVREHAMGAIAVGAALHGGVIPYTGTFMTFADYMRTPMRLAALMGLRAVFIFTHDSIGLGEDGPTHQPIEHLMTLRVIPDLLVLRPCDANETVEAWRLALQRQDGPTVLALTRQNVPVLDRTECGAAAGVSRGAYILWEAGSGTPDIILIGTGSELHIALDAGRQLAAEGCAVRVVSMPSCELFDAQPEEYRHHVLPPRIDRRVAIEAGVTRGWERYTGAKGHVIGIDHFGRSAPYQELYERFGFTVAGVLAAARRLLKS